MEEVTRFCDESDNSALLEMTDYQTRLTISIAKYALSLSNSRPETITTARKILNTLETPPPHGNECSKIEPLTYTGDSCYLDSAMTALFAVPTSFVHTNILAATLTERADYTRDKTAKQDVVARRCVQKELIRIANSTRGDGPVVTNCTNLREIMRDCPHIEKYHKTGPRDAGEFLAYILSMFPTAVATHETVTNGIIVEADGTDSIIQISKRIDNNSAVILNVDQSTLLNSFMGITVNIDSFLVNKMEHNIESDKLEDAYRVGSGDEISYFFRSISTVSVIDSPFLVFQFQRVVQVERNGRRKAHEERIDIPVLPMQSITFASGKTINLTAVVVWGGSHYTCCIRCGDEWYRYNDLGKTRVRKIGSYKKMLLTRPSPITASSLCYYG
jgi:ubiquitin C-terminal hydrolase